MESNPENKPETRDLSSIEFGVDEGIDRAVSAIRALADKKADGPVVVCIAGGSSTGKSSIVLKRLLKGLGDDVLSLTMDNYYKNRQFIVGSEEKSCDVVPGVPFMDTGKADNWDQPQALDLKLLAHHLNELKQGKKIESPVYTMNGSYRTGETIPIDPSGKNIVLIEGLFALNDQIVDFVHPDFKIYVGSAEEDDDAHGRIIRRLMRDPARTGLGEKDIFDYWIDVIEPMHRKYIAPTKEKADIIINNEFDPQREGERLPKTEVQINFELTPEEVRQVQERLKAAGGKLKESFEQFDEYMLLPGHKAKNTDELLRLRRQGEQYFITYKVPAEKGLEGVRAGSKIEFELTPDVSAEEVGKLMKVLQNFGYKTFDTISKYRTLYDLDGLEIAIDDIEGMGPHLEIRADTKEEIESLNQVLDRLGLSNKPRITDSYIVRKAASRK